MQEVGCLDTSPFLINHFTSFKNMGYKSTNSLQQATLYQYIILLPGVQQFQDLL